MSVLGPLTIRPDLNEALKNVLEFGCGDTPL